MLPELSNAFDFTFKSLIEPLGLELLSSGLIYRLVPPDIPPTEFFGDDTAEWMTLGYTVFMKFFLFSTILINLM